MKYNDFYVILCEVSTERTAKEIAGMCRTIEREFGVDLDKVATSPDRDALRRKVDGMTRKSVDKYKRYLEKYFEFADFRHTNTGWIPASAEIKPLMPKPHDYFPLSDHFYSSENDMPPKVIINMLPELERHYECIMGFAHGIFESRSLERIPVILSPEEKDRLCEADKNYWLIKIRDIIKYKKGDISEDDIRQILWQETFSFPIMGEFCAENEKLGPHIVLYYKAIGGNAKKERIARFLNVLAHEYMHYIEYTYCSEKLVKHCLNEFLSEAMADFFGVMHSVKTNTKESLGVARCRYKEWKNMEGTNWPYAKALHFYSVDGFEMGYSNNYAMYETYGCIQKLIEVFECCDKPDLAYSILKK